jgi:DNA replication protein DnaC
VIGDPSERVGKPWIKCENYPCLPHYCSQITRTCFYIITIIFLTLEEIKMLVNQTIDKLRALRLLGMVNALSEQMAHSDINALSFEERLGFLVDRETTDRENRRLKTRLIKAKLRQTATVEDIDFNHSRGLDKSLVKQLSNCDWIKDHHNLLIVGPTGTGKSFIACALAHKACLGGYTAYYARLPRLLPELIIAKGDGSYMKRLNELAKIDSLILDDFGLINLTAENRRDLLEIFDDRHGRKSTIITSQLPIKLWHETINDGTLADAILDRLVHNAYKLELKGESMRKIKGNIKS